MPIRLILDNVCLCYAFGVLIVLGRCAYEDVNYYSMLAIPSGFLAVFYLIRRMVKYRLSFKKWCKFFYKV
jgi:hypothetical protein